MWIILNFNGRSKTKIMARNTYKRTLYIEFHRDWWVGLGTALGDGKKLKIYFPVSGIFPGKFASITLLGFECTINPQNLIKIVLAIFENLKIFNFFLMWTTLNFMGRGKTKNKSSRYLREDPRYRFWTRLICLFRPYVRRRKKI